MNNPARVNIWTFSMSDWVRILSRTWESRLIYAALAVIEWEYSGNKLASEGYNPRLVWSASAVWGWYGQCSAVYGCEVQCGANIISTVHSRAVKCSALLCCTIPCSAAQCSYENWVQVILSMKKYIATNILLLGFFCLFIYSYLLDIPWN